MNRGIYSFSLGKSFSKAGQMPSYLLVADDVLCGDISKFYELYRWDGWRDDVRNFNLDKVMFALPPLLWQDANARLRLKDMKKDGVNIDEYFVSLFKGEK